MDKANLAANSTCLFYKNNLVVVEHTIGEGSERVYIYALDAENIQKERKMYEPNMPDEPIDCIKTLTDDYVILQYRDMEGSTQRELHPLAYVTVYFDGRKYELEWQTFG